MAGRFGYAGIALFLLAALAAGAAESERPRQGEAFSWGPGGGEEELLAKLAERDDWESITIRRAHLSARVFEALANCREVRRLHLTGTRDDGGRWRLDVDPGALAPLGRLEKLEEVVFSEVAPGEALPALAPCPALRKIYMESVPEFDEDRFEAIGRFPRLESFMLNAGNQTPITMTAKGFAHLARCPTLNEIFLALTKPVDARMVLKELAPLPDLRSLFLPWTGFDDEALARLAAQWPDMTKVSLEELSAAAAETLALMPALASVSLENADDDMARRLAALSGLTEVSLSGDRLTDDGAAALAALPALRKITLGGPELTDRCLETVVTRIPHLQDVSLSDGRFTDAGIIRLAAAPELRVVVLNRALLSPAGEAAFKQQRPEVDLFFITIFRNPLAEPPPPPPASAPEEEFF